MLAYLQKAADICRKHNCECQCGYTHHFFGYHLTKGTPIEKLQWLPEMGQEEPIPTYIWDISLEDTFKEFEKAWCAISLELHFDCDPNKCDCGRDRCDCKWKLILGKCPWPRNELPADHCFVLVRDGERYILCDSYVYKKKPEAKYIDIEALKDLLEHPTIRKWSDFFGVKNIHPVGVECSVRIVVGKRLSF